MINSKSKGKELKSPNVEPKFKISKHFDSKTVLIEYRKAVKAKYIGKTFDSRVTEFLKPYLINKKYGFLLTSLRMLNRIEKKSAEYFYVIGTIYLARADWEELTRFDSNQINKTRKKALKFLSKAMDVKPLMIEFATQLSYIYGLMGKADECASAFKKALIIYNNIKTKVDNKIASDYLHLLRSVKTKLISHLFVNKVEERYFIKKDENSTTEALRRALIICKNNCRMNYLMGYINSVKNPNFALKYFEKCNAIEPQWADPYNQEANIYFIKNNLEKSTIYAKRAIQLIEQYDAKLPRRYCDALLSLPYHIMGIWQWQLGNLSCARSYFTKSSSAFRTGNKKIAGYFSILPSLIDFDIEILKFADKNSLNHLKRDTFRVYNKYLRIFKLNSSRPITNPVLNFLIHPKICFVASIVATLDKKFHTSYMKSLSRWFVENKTTSSFHLPLNRDYVIKYLEYNRNKFLKIGYNNVVQALNLLENFVLETRKYLKIYQTIEKIPLNLQIKLIRSLKMFTVTMNGNASRYTVHKVLTEYLFNKEILRLKSDVYTQLKQEGTNLATNLGEIIKSEFELQRANKIKGTETSKEEVKILTNVDDNEKIIESELKPRDINLEELKGWLEKKLKYRQYYLFWIVDESISGMNEQTKGIFIRGKRISISDIPQIFLLIHLASPNIVVPYLDLWEAVRPTEKGRKLIYTDDTNDRARIYRWFQRLRNDTESIQNLNLKNYFINKKHRRLVTGHKPGLSISGYVFTPGVEKFLYVYPSDT
jgi:tetratricopeptide (TPR) repeat protein